VKIPFEIEWLGGAAEHRFRKIRPGADDLPWGTVPLADYSPTALEFARAAWTDVAFNEYRAIAAFSEVLRAMVDVKAPLDLLGMTSDFLADECAHVELASRMAMELGGAAPRTLDPDRFAACRNMALSPLQRANELVLCVSCLAEAFAGGTASLTLETTTHPLPRAIYERVLRDEAHHRRLGGLYFEWAFARLDEAELLRLGQVMLSALKGYAPLWSTRSAAREAIPELSDAEVRSLGWPAPASFAPIARDVVVREILDPLSAIGISISPEERADLLGPSLPGKG
jgi:hypothetical protein